MLEKLKIKKQEFHIWFYCCCPHEDHKPEKKFCELTDKIKTEKENTELAKKLIKNNLQMPLSFHIHNLNTN